MTRQHQKRKSQIVAELTRLSHQGWDQCRREDWEPLEAELRGIEARQ